jgi:hypothetical protein
VVAGCLTVRPATVVILSEAKDLSGPSSALVRVDPSVTAFPRDDSGLTSERRGKIPHRDARAGSRDDQSLAETIPFRRLGC